MRVLRKIEKIKGFSCTKCHTTYLYEHIASSCCKPSFGEDGYTCPDVMCFQLHETQEEAEDCGRPCESCEHMLKWHQPNAIDRCSAYGWDKDNHFQYWECDCTENKWKKVSNVS